MSTAARTIINKTVSRQPDFARRDSNDGSRAVAVICDALSVVAMGLLFVRTHLPTPSAAQLRSLHSAYWQNVTFALLFVPIVVLCCHWQHLYTRAQQKRTLQLLLAVFSACAVATAFWICVIYVSGAKGMSRFVVITAGVGTFFALSAWRLIHRYLEATRVHAGAGRNLLIVGSGSSARAIADYVRSKPFLGYRVLGFVEKEKKPGSDLLGEISNIREIALAKFVDEIIMSTPSDKDAIRFVAREIADLGIALSVLPETYDGFGISYELLGDMPTMMLFRRPENQLEMAAKRIFDIIGSGLLLILLLPTMAAIALAVLFDSGGPIIYSSKRVGRKGTIFQCHKFRTMVPNADALKESLRHLNEREGLLFKVTNDPRITRVGRFMRKYSLDELPQLWNVFMGEMSLVGPRPALPSEVDSYSPEHSRRIMVKPGITGLWQVQARSNPSFDAYINLDIQYVEQFSLWLDVQILLRTVIVVLAGTGS